MRTHKQPSIKQLKAISIKASNPKMSNKQAALMAGYSPATAQNASKNIFQKPIVQTWLDNYKYTLNKHDINPERLAITLDELLDDKNAKLRLETVRVIHDVFGIKGNQSQESNNLKKRITLEEFESEEFSN